MASKKTRVAAGGAGRVSAAEEQTKPFGGVFVAHSQMAEELCRLRKCEEWRDKGRGEKRGWGWGMMKNTT